MTAVPAPPYSRVVVLVCTDEPDKFLRGLLLTATDHFDDCTFEETETGRLIVRDADNEPVREYNTKTGRRWAGVSLVDKDTTDVQLVPFLREEMGLCRDAVRFYRHDLDVKNASAPRSASVERACIDAAEEGLNLWANPTAPPMAWHQLHVALKLMWKAYPSTEPLTVSAFGRVSGRLSVYSPDPSLID